MTIRQVSVLLAAHGRDERRQQRDMLLLMRAAQSDRKGFNAVRKALEKG